MTTTMTVKNHATSNGDISFTRRAPTHISRTVIAPGETLTEAVSGNEDIEITELWPQRSPPAGQHAIAMEQVQQDVDREAMVQIKMWGTDREDNKSDELLSAALTSAAAVFGTRKAIADKADWPREKNFEHAKEAFYPKNWSPDAFRDYGSDYANLAVAAAYLMNQMLIMRMKGEDTGRSRRGEPYVSASPRMSATAAGANPVLPRS